jgi:hypothetical protein
VSSICSAKQTISDSSILRKQTKPIYVIFVTSVINLLLDPNVWPEFVLDVLGQDKLAFLEKIKTVKLPI